MFAGILGQEAQHEVAVLLKQGVLAPVAAIRIRISQVLIAIRLDGPASLGTQEIDLHPASPEAFEVTVLTIEKIRKSYVLEGLGCRII